MHKHTNVYLGTVREQRPIWTPSGFYYLIVSFIDFIVLL